MPDDLLERVRRFRDRTFPGVQDPFQNLMEGGKHPTLLFIGCSDSRPIPCMLTGTGPGKRFRVRCLGRTGSVSRPEIDRHQVPAAVMWLAWRVCHFGAAQRAARHA